MLHSAVSLLAKGEDSAKVNDLVLDGNEEGMLPCTETPMPSVILFDLPGTGILRAAAPLTLRMSLDLDELMSMPASVKTACKESSDVAVHAAQVFQGVENPRTQVVIGANS